MKRRFYTLDVFTEQRFCGNPLAVVIDGDGLGDAAMQTIAREFNLSETVFVSAPRNPIHSAAVRIFTPASELPFAGHPTVGTGVLLAHLKARDHMAAPGGVVIALEEKIGLVNVEVSVRPGRAARGVFTLPRLPEPVDWQPDASAIAAALGVDPLDIGFAAHAPCAWSAGVPFVMVPLRGLAAVAQAAPGDAATWHAAFGAVGRGAVFLYTRETQKPEHHVHARMFAPKLGVTEDPATGSAAAAFAGPAVLFERPEDGLHQIIIEQGYEMGRPSEIVLDLDVQHGRLAGARIGGGAVIVSEGTIEA